MCSVSYKNNAKEKKIYLFKASKNELNRQGLLVLNFYHGLTGVGWLVLAGLPWHGMAWHGMA